MTDEKILEYTEKVQKLLDRDHICADVYPHYGLPVVVIDIHWGDWKHDHGRAKWLVSQHGGNLIGSKVTEENGSDCYSAEHYFYFGDGWKDGDEND